MDTSVISSKYQVVIPHEIRKNNKFLPGQKVKFIYYDDRLEIIPLVDLKNLIGICEGMDSTFVREEDDRI